MAHQRTLIRNAVKALLLNHTDAGTRVHTTQLIPWQRSELPAASIYTLEESSDNQQTGPRSYKRELQLVVEIGIEAVETGMDDALDNLADQVERAMAVDYTLGNLAEDCTLVQSEMEITVLGKRELGFMRLGYVVTYYTDMVDLAPATLDDFDTADIHYNLENSQAVADQAHDLVIDLET